MLARLISLLTGVFLFACSGASSTDLFDEPSPATDLVTNDAGTTSLLSPKKQKDAGVADAERARDAGSESRTPPKDPACALANISLSKSTCSDCWTKSCCTEWKACDADPSCVELQTCIGACAPGEDDCIKDCVFLYPNGRDGVVAVYECGEKSCAPQCE